jgi:hypothetical protein
MAIRGNQQLVKTREQEPPLPRLTPSTPPTTMTDDSRTELIGGMDATMLGMEG